MAERRLRAAANRLLLVNAGIMAAALAAYPLFWREWSSETAAYAAIVAGLLLLCGVAAIITKTASPAAGVTFYAWAGLGAVCGMVALDIVNGARQFPWVLYLLPLGALVLGMFGAHEQRALFSIAALFAIIAAGVVYSQFDQAVPCAALCIIAATLEVKYGRRWT